MASSSYLPVSNKDLDGSQDRVGQVESSGKVQTAHMATTTLKVEGMTCGACTSAIESGFKDVNGVGTFSVSLVMGRAVVVHDPEQLSAEQAKEIIEDRGFDAEVLSSDLPDSRTQNTMEPLNVDGQENGNSNMRTTTLAVEGMTCGACTSAVESGFKDVAGVVRFNISLLAERAVLVHDAIQLPPEKIVEIIEDRGFDTKIISSVSTGNHQNVAPSSIQLKLFGVTSSEAAQSLERDLQALKGVDSVNINYKTSRATINYQASIIGLRALVEAIENTGFNALVADADDNNAQLESLSKTKEIQEWRRAFRVSISFAIPVFLISMAIPMFLSFLDFGSYELPVPGLFLGDIICLSLTVPVQFGIGRRFYISAFRSLKHGSPTMDVLVVLGTSTAFFFSCAAMIVSILKVPHSRPATIFDTSTMLITFITLGRYLENRAKGQTSKALSRLMSLAPSMATIYIDPIAAEKAAEQWDKSSDSEKEKSYDMSTASDDQNASNERTIPTELIQVGDIVILRPGDKIPADGTVTRGEAYVDESMVTGEAMPIFKRQGSLLIGGTVNGSGQVDFRVTRAGRDTQLSQIVKLVQEAQTSRAPIQRMADIVAGYFVPTIILLGVITFVGWMVLSHMLPHPPKIFLDEASGGTFMVCLKLCISVIVFACPCALGLSTPTAVMVGTGVGAENGILVKGGAALETATKITHVVLDKTGTLTMGKMSVAQTNVAEKWTTTDTQRRLWWSLIGLAEMNSEHPIGRAIVARAKEELQITQEATIPGSIGGFTAKVGRGVTTMITVPDSSQRFEVLVGNEAYLLDCGVNLPSSSSTTPTTTIIYTAINSSYAGSLALADTLKFTAPATIAALHRLNITTSLVTGDQSGPAHAIASLVGIVDKNVHAGVSPDEKQSIIRSLQRAGETVAMVGDGINDSPALATADVGIAMASGTDVAMEAADVVLMRPLDLMSIPASLHLARTIFNRIKLNLIWACAYNIIGLPFAMGIFLPFGWHLHPMAAGAAMAASSVSVVVSSLLLKFWHRPSWMNSDGLESRDAQKDGRLQALLDPFRALKDVFGAKKREEEGYLPLETVEPA